MNGKMIRCFIFVFLFFFTTNPSVLAQKSKVFAVFHLIETGKYEEAKEAIEDATNEESTKQWPRTWYARGLLYQTAYEKGKKENNKKKYELISDQLYEAYESYEKTLLLDKRGRFDEHLAPLYVQLANDFQKAAQDHFGKKEYKEALKAFEHAIMVNESSLISPELDANLLYNTAITAYLAEKWEKSIEYLDKLNRETYSSDIPKLMSSIYLERTDTTAAEKVLIDGIERYENNDEIVLLLVDLLYKKDNIKEAVSLLDSASSKSPSEYIFPYTKGLIYQKTDKYREAIDSYKKALSLAPDELDIYTNMGTCYYNIGVDIEEKARTIQDKRHFLEEKEKSSKAFKSAVSSFERAIEQNPDNQDLAAKLNQLYEVLNITDEMRGLEK